MTREEAIETLMIVDENASCDNCLYYAQMEDCPDDEDCVIRQALDMAINALEQENDLNEMFENIKTEIDFIPTYGAKFADGSINVHVNKKDVLQIIDKHTKEGDA